MSVDPAPTGSLRGLRVLDLSRVLAGPLCTQMLADHGATVIKVEPPAGDETRSWGPPFVREGESAYFAALNRNKRNIALDLTTAQGRALLGDLLADTDVLVENYKVGTLARWGLDDATLRTRYPALIHCRITGFGSDGPLGGAPGYDAIAQAYSGLMSINGEASGPPLRVGVPVVDMLTGVFAFSGVLLAVVERQHSGRGQLVDCTLLDSAVSLLHPHSSSWFVTGTDPVRSGSAHPTIAPYDVFMVGDQPFFIGAGNDRQFRQLCEELGTVALADDTRFATNPDRVRNLAELRPVLAEALSRRDPEELGRALLRRGVPASPVHSVTQALTDPQVRQRSMVVDTDAYTGVGIPVKLDRTPGSIRSGPRPLGADTRDVLAAIGYAPELVDDLIDTGVVRVCESEAT
jgi:crotonobetainyl-CoA:carnitine CoA-transferase CaiB-like acyl-CoA transferase